MHNYAEFYHSLSGYYVVYLKYIAALTFSKKILLLKFSKDRKLKTKIYLHQPLYHISSH